MGIRGSVPPVAAGPIWNIATPSKARRFATEFAAAEPFPHVVIDGLFDPLFLERVIEEFELIRHEGWEWYDNDRERKQGTRPGRALPPFAQAYFDAVYSGPFLRAVGAISGIDDLIVDPTLFGGGLHLMPRGGRFDLHTDFQRHPRTGLDTRLVLITYLNPDWRAEHGGALELWDKNCSTCVTRIIPEFGRTILMQSPDCPHGVAPVTGPADLRRRSLAAYFYTHGAVQRPGGASTTTTFLRPRQHADDARWLIKRIAPPVLLDAARALLRKDS